MRLTELEPRFAVDGDIVIGGVRVHDDDRHLMGLSFLCPCCRTQRLAIFFANPLDGKSPSDDATHLWHREGDTFETLTLSPSIDASAYGHWHGFLVDGEVK